ncbi:MAG: PEP-CTERM sorting domain-containing protein [Desulfuromonadaceae bacterium]
MKKKLLAVLVSSLLLAGMVGAANATLYSFDANADANVNGGGGSPTQAGYTSIFYTSTYNATLGYGWDHAVTQDRDRGAIAGDPLSNLLRDLHFSNTDATFKLDVVNGLYDVTLYFRDNQFSHDKIQVFAESATTAAVDIATIATNTTYTRTFSALVTDGQLDLRFHDYGGPDINWIINGLQVDGPAPVPEPGTMALLGLGMLGMAVYGKRRMNKEA